eukprot:evm.model.scf_575EXC.7 EVM.evm.TU.scf_575EXC.7   scf_575EXC:62970-64597(-)
MERRLPASFVVPKERKLPKSMARPEAEVEVPARRRPKGRVRGAPSDPGSDSEAPLRGSGRKSPPAVGRAGSQPTKRRREDGNGRKSGSWMMTRSEMLAVKDEVLLAQCRAVVGGAPGRSVAHAGGEDSRMGEDIGTRMQDDRRKYRGGDGGGTEEDDGRRAGEDIGGRLGGDGRKGRENDGKGLGGDDGRRMGGGLGAGLGDTQPIGDLPAELEALRRRGKGGEGSAWRVEEKGKSMQNEEVRIEAPGSGSNGIEGRGHGSAGAGSVAQRIQVQEAGKEMGLVDGCRHGDGVSGQGPQGHVGRFGEGGDSVVGAPIEVGKSCLETERRVGVPVSVAGGVTGGLASGSASTGTSTGRGSVGGARKEPGAGSGRKKPTMADILMEAMMDDSP